MECKMQSQWLEPITLEGETVRLESLAKSHGQALLEAASDGELWRLWYTSVPSPDTMESYLVKALDERRAGVALPFVVVEKSSGQVIGATRFCNADPANRRVEIGYTWYARRFQRTRINTECKRLLLGHAFETLDAIAVEFRTHWHNQASRAAIARLGAKQDGVLRNHQVDSQGNYRDTVVFSIINQEWPVVRQSLDFKLAQPSM